MWVNKPVERHTAINACTFINALELHPAFTVHGPKMSIEIRENGASTSRRWYEAIFQIIVPPRVSQKSTFSKFQVPMGIFPSLRHIQYTMQNCNSQIHDF